MAPAKIIAVTGGNRGIGQEICRQLAAQGHHVLLCSRDLEKGRAAAEAMQGRVEEWQLDVGDEDSIHKFATEVAQRYSHLDALVNNAGILLNSKGALRVNMEEMRSTFETNFFGPMLLSQLLAPMLRKAVSGRIINVSSEMGALKSLHSGYAAYRLSKAALNAMTILMAHELHGEGISVNAMCPGWVKTDMGGKGAVRSVAQGADTAVWLATATAVPTGKFLRDRKEIPW